MKLRDAVLIATLAAGPLAAQQGGSAPPGLDAQIHKIEGALTEITGLKFTKPVASAIIDKSNLHSYLEQRMREAVKPEDLHAEQVTLRMLGLIPADFDLQKTTVELLTEQAAAFYDYQKKKLYIIAAGETADIGAAGRDMALAHELAHALADQNFHLEKYVREGSRSDDSATARLAVMEGQASWLMSAYTAIQATGNPEVPSAIVELMMKALESGAEQYPVFTRAPLYLRQSLVFPYAAGMLFQSSLFEKLGRESFGEPFRHPPESTQQIIHPEKYFARVKPVIPKLPDIRSTRHFRSLAKGTLGEFDFRVLLEQYAGKSEAESLAPRLTGSAYEVWESKDGGRPLLAVASNWATPEDARRFFRRQRDILIKKSKSADFTMDSEQEMAGSTEAGYFRIRLDDARVDSIEGSSAQLH